MKTCIDCGLDLPNAHALTKRCPACKVLDSRKRAAKWQKDNAERVNEKNREWRAANYEAVREREKAYVEANKEACRAAYRKSSRRRNGVVDPHGEVRTGRCENLACSYEGPLVLDHEHVTGAARGWLCQFCNRGLGQFKDSAAIARGGADYLDRFRPAD